MIRKVSSLAIVSIFFMLLIYCTKDMTSPDTEHFPPGSRNYIWELDTLDMPMNYISSVWGASPTDVWAVGGGGTFKDRLQHYDGEKWSAYTKEPINIGAFALFGFAADDIWMGGQAGWGYHGAAIWNYNGTMWSQNFIFDVEGSYSAEVQDMWSSNPDDIYASGFFGFYDGVNTDVRGFLLHYNGEDWCEVVRGPFDSQFLRVRKEENSVYVHSVAIGLGNADGVGSVSNETLTFYKIEDNKLKSIYTAKGISGDLSLIDEKTYFVIDKDVYRYIDGNFIKQFSLQQFEFKGAISGRRRSDLFLHMKDGVAHHNGKNVEYLYRFPRNNIKLNNNAVIFEKDVFFCGLGRNFENIVLHGRLDE